MLDCCEFCFEAGDKFVKRGVLCCINCWFNDKEPLKPDEIVAFGFTTLTSKTDTAVLEITVGHWPFSNKFQHLANQNPFWSANFTVHFQWDGNQ